MRVFLVERIRAHLSAIHGDWARDEEFSQPGLDVWLRRDPYGAAKLNYWRENEVHPAITPVAALVTFCRQMGGIDVRRLIEDLGDEGLYRGPLA